MTENTDEDKNTYSGEIQKPTATDNDGNEPTVQCQPESPLPLGPNTITCTATDAAENVAECQYTITVEGKLLNFTKLAEHFGNCQVC